MDSKNLRHVEVKNEDRGQVSAVFATFDVIDSDKDVTVPGAFDDGAEVLISSYGHTSWGGALPVGKGTIRTTRSEAILEGQFFMDTAAGRDTFSVVKQVGPKQEWSYGFDVVESEPGTFDEQPVRFLKRMKVHEVSPVLLGAGVNTRTLSAKARKEGVGAMIAAERSSTAYAAAIRPHETSTSRKAWDPAGAAAALSLTPAVGDLRAVHAWVDPAGDPEAKSSYRFLHHDQPGGPANLRACLIGIGALDSGRGETVPEQDRRGVYNHLAAHLDDGGVEPPELSGDGMMKQNSERAVVLADLAAARSRAWQTRTARARKGRPLGATTVLTLEWVYDELRALKSVMDSPQEDAVREHVRFLASQFRLPEGA